MVDRPARDRLASNLRSYMDEEITAFQFDDLLEKFRPFPTDRTVECIARDLWGCYDDCKDHKVVASKQTWDYFNRVLLLLASDAEIEQVRNGLEWHASQMFAGVCFLLVLLLTARFGWNNFLAVWIPFGLVSIRISLFQQRQRYQSADQALYPFPSFSALSFVRRSIKSFTKKVLSKEVVHRKIRPTLVTWMYWTFWGILCVIFSPVVLFIHALPKRAWQRRLKTSSA